jgi:hypothetical protein
MNFTDTIIGAYMNFFDEFDKQIFYFLIPLLWTFTFSVVATDGIKASIIGLVGMLVVITFMDIIQRSLLNKCKLLKTDREITAPPHRAAIKLTLPHRWRVGAFFIVSWLALYGAVYLKSQNII